jgi:F-type H+-transporting ATPase subunit b
MLELDIVTIIWQIVNFLVLATALYFALFRPVIRKMQEQETERERVAREAMQDRQEAERLRATLENRLAGVEQEATAIVSRAQEKAEAERANLLQEAESEAERILAEAHANANRLGNQAIDEFQDELLSTILTVSGQVIGQVAPPEVHDTLIKQLCNRIWEMGHSEMQQVETLRRSLGEREPTAYVTTAHPLSSEQQGQLARTFTALADRHVNLEVTSDPVLAAGVRIRLGDLVIDNSIGDRLNSLRKSISQSVEEQLNGE